MRLVVLSLLAFGCAADASSAPYSVPVPAAAPRACAQGPVRTLGVASARTPSAFVQGDSFYFAWDGTVSTLGPSEVWSETIGATGAKSLSLTDGLGVWLDHDGERFVVTAQPVDGSGKWTLADLPGTYVDPRAHPEADGWRVYWRRDERLESRHVARDGSLRPVTDPVPADDYAVAHATWGALVARVDGGEVLVDDALVGEGDDVDLAANDAGALVTYVSRDGVVRARALDVHGAPVGDFEVLGRGHSPSVATYGDAFLVVYGGDVVRLVFLDTDARVVDRFEVAPETGIPTVAVSDAGRVGVAWIRGDGAVVGARLDCPTGWDATR